MSIDQSLRRPALLAMLARSRGRDSRLGDSGPRGGQPARTKPLRSRRRAGSRHGDSGRAERLLDHRGRRPDRARCLDAPRAATSVEAGVSTQAAVGLAPLNDSDGGSNIASVPATRASCWASQAWHQWGTWPYQQRITDSTYWCAVFDKHITYRTSTTTASGLLCGVSWRASALIGGGIGPGFTYFINRASANFTCQTAIPWIAIHTTHHLDTKRTDRGVTTEVGFG